MSFEHMRALVIYKKSAYQRFVRERRNRRIQRLLADGDKTVTRLKEADEDHRATIEHTRAVLKELGVKATFRSLNTKKRSSEPFDIVITLGGDGTLLWASHMVTHDRPMLAVNTAPNDSVGYFCAATRDDLDATVVAALSGRLPGTELTRMQVELDGRLLSKRVLNDILFCHACPAATTRYLLQVGDAEEDQKSSGLWIGPAAGSTAAQRSAGGRMLPLRSDKLQYVVRELYEYDPAHQHLKKGLLEPGEDLRIRSKIADGRVYLDGPHRHYRVPFGAELRMTRSDQPLTLLGLERRRR